MINLENAEKIMDNYMPLIYATVKRFHTFDLEEAIDENYHFWDKAKIPHSTSLDEDVKDDLKLKDLIKNEDDLEDDFFTKEAYKDLYDKINKLDKKDVIIIKLKYWENLSDKKIGKIMNLSAKTIRNRHSLALKTLRKMYEK